MNPNQRLRLQLTRRAFLGNTGAAVGGTALLTLLQRVGAAPVEVPRWPGVARPLHFPPRAKRVIYLYMAGGPSHLETFDYKPTLAKMHGQPMPESFTKGQPIAQLQGQKLNCLEPQFRFCQFGRSGKEMTELFTQLG